MMPRGGGFRSFHVFILTLFLILITSNPIRAGSNEIIADSSSEDSISNTQTSTSGTPQSHPENADEETDLTSGDSGSEQPAESEAGVSADSSATISSTSGAGEGNSETAGISTPTVDAFQYTGAATGKIPIIVPPGRNGVQPNLAITYNSYMKNGWIGVGWGLDMGFVQRSTKRGVDYLADDFIVNNGGAVSELVIRSDWGNNFYGARIEGAFTKYYFNPATEGWEAAAKDGTRYFYGTTAASRQDDPDDSSRVFKWCLDRVEDTNGNYMSIAYDKFPAPENENTGQIYLKRIEYTGNRALAPYYSIEFYLEDRKDKPVMMTPQFEVITTKRLKSIVVATAGELVRAYKLEYGRGPITRRTLLKSVQQFGADALVDESGEVSGDHRLPPILAGWHNDSTNTFTNAYFSASGFEGYPITSKRDVAFPFDYNGDGHSDLFFMRPDSDMVGIIRSNGDGTFENVYGFTALDLAGYRLNSARDRAFAFDYNGDGNSDIFFYRPDSNIAGIMHSKGDDGFENIYYSHSGFYGYPITSERDRAFPFDYDGDGDSDIFFYRPDSNMASIIRSNGDGTFENIYYSGSGFYGYQIRSKRDIAFPFDYNGDGYSDIFFYRIDSDWACVIKSNGDGSFERVFNSTTGIGGYHITSERDQAFPLDFNGDGFQDIFFYRPDSNRAGIARSNGDGTFSQAFFSTSGIAGYSIGSLRDRAFAFDENGDGMSDIFLYRPDSNYCGVARSNGDGTFEQAYLSISGIGGYGINSVRDRAFAFDYNGNGRSDIFFYRPDSNLAAVVRSGDKFPDLLSTMDNGSGATTAIEYTPSSGYANTLLPFIVHTVSKIAINDGLENLSASEFSYSGGFFDYDSREFRGFETVVQTNPDGTQLRSWFHQDKWFKGRQYRQELSAQTEIEAILSNTNLSWDKAILNEPDNSAAFIKLIRKHAEFNDDVTVFSQENYTYDDASGNLLSKTTSGTDGEEITISNAYANLGNWLWRKTSETVAGSISGKVRESYFGYEADTGNLLHKELWLDDGTNPRIEITYDAYGNPKTVTDARGNTTTTEYDPTTYSYPVKTVYPRTGCDTSGGCIDHIVENEAWDYRFGKVNITKDENGNRTYCSYDAFGRPVQVDSPNGGQVTTEYFDDVFPRYAVTKVKEDESGNTIDVYQYVDGLGREIQTITFGEDGKSIVTKKFYDSMGRNDLIEGPFFSTGVGYPLYPSEVYPWQQVAFDLRGRPETIESANGEYGSVVATFTYSGLSITATDPDGGSKTENQDYLGRVIQVVEHADQADFITTYDYNAAGDLLQVTDHYQNITTMRYDTLGRKVSMNDPDMGFWEYAYDAGGNLEAQTDEKLQTIKFEYDELNRLISKTYSTSDPAVIYTYDNLLIPNGRGRLYAVSNSQATTTYNAYDAMGNATSVSKTIAGDPVVYTTRYMYDLSGKITRTIYPDGHQVSNAYYAGTGLLEAVSGSDSVEYARLSNYEPSGKIGLIEYANGVFTEYRYEPESTRLIAIVTSKAGPTIDLQNKTYAYTHAGDIQSISDTVNNITYTYAYDRLHRLIQESNTAALDPIRYTYNAIGNLTAKAVGDTTLAYAYDEWHVHAVKNISFNGVGYTYSYDENGNMIQAPDFTNRQQVATRSITYNADNMPLRIHYENGKPQPLESRSTSRSSNSSKSRSNVTAVAACWIDTLSDQGDVSWTVDFYYDGEGVRVKKHVLGGSQTYYIGAHFEIKDGVATKYIFAGSLRIAMIKGAAVNYFHKDHLGSSTVMTDSDGELIESTEFMPFGAAREHSGPNVSDYKFTDQEFDAESGLYNFNARLYDPLIGRFITPDSIVQAPYDPQTLNRYSYARNNPLIYVDPSGHFFLLDDILIGAAIGAFIGGTTSAIIGGDVGQGIFMGAISGAFFGAAGGIIDAANATAVLSTVEQAGIHAAAGAISGGINAAISDNNIGLGILTGGLSAGVANFIGANLPQDFLTQLLSRTAIGGITGGITAEIYGGSFGEGFAYGAATGAYGYICNHLLHGILNALNKYHEVRSEVGNITEAAISTGETINDMTNALTPKEMSLNVNFNSGWWHFIEYGAILASAHVPMLAAAPLAGPGAPILYGVGFTGVAAGVGTMYLGIRRIDINMDIKF
jgi:RHS repeat-associated protein